MNLLHPLKRLQNTRGPLLLVLLSAVVSLNFAAGAAIPSAEKLLPNDTLVVLTVPDFAKMKEVMKTSPELQLWNDPAMKPFRTKFESRVKEDLLQPLEQDLGIKFDDYASLPQGQLTVALVQDGWDGSSDQYPAGVLLLPFR